MNKLFVCLFILLVFKVSSQSTFNIVIPSGEVDVETLYHPAIECFDKSTLLKIPVFLRTKYGGATKTVRIDNLLNIYGNTTYSDTNSIIYLRDIALTNSGIIGCGQKFIIKDTLYEYYIIKWNKHCEVQWEKCKRARFQLPYYKKLIISKEENKIILCGSIGQTTTIARPAATSESAIISILDSLGTEINHIEFNDGDTNTFESFHGIFEDKLNNIYACGQVKSNFLTSDGIIFKVNSIGQLKWKKKISTKKYNETLHSIMALNDSSVLLLGGAINRDFFGNKFSFLVIYCINFDGDILWEKRIFEGYDNYNVACIPDKDGNILCCGTARFKEENSYDGWICKLSKMGEPIWSRVINNFEPSNEQFNNISILADGGFTLSGHSWLENIYSSKPWIVKVDSFGCLVPGCQKVVSTENISIGISKVFEIYPNPIHRVLYYLSRLELVGACNLFIYNLQGNQIYQYPFKANIGNQYQVNLPEDMMPGMYLLKIQDSKGYDIFQEKIEVY